MLTIDKIKIYNKFKGDIDEYARSINASEHNLLSNDDWYLIDEFEQDTELISNRFVSKEYRENALMKQIDKCDSKTLEYFTSKIPFYNDFKELSEIIKHIKTKINNNTETVWAGFDNIEALIKELDYDQKQINFLDFETLEKIMVEFLPTGTYQELAMSNEWSDEYLQLANKFDTIYERIKAKVKIIDSKNINKISTASKKSQMNLIWLKLKKIWS